jgi:hypothetical protein
VRNEAGSGHYQVCYGPAANGNFYLADPATCLYTAPEKELLASWTGHALYFAALEFAHAGYRSWPALLSLRLFPRIFWILLPATHLVTVCFGLALSWVLQRGLNYPLIGYSIPAAVLLTLLLFLLLLFKALLLYLRDRVLIHLESYAGAMLAASPHLVFQEIQLIKDAWSLFAVILLSEGNLMLLAMTALLWVQPVVCGCCLAYLTAMALAILFDLPRMHRDNASLNDLAAANFQQPQTQGIHARYLRLSKRVSLVNSRIRLAYECIGILYLMAVFTIGLVQLYRQLLDYRSFLVLVILSYVIAQLAPKVCAAACLIDRGAEAARQLLYRAGK